MRKELIIKVAESLINEFYQVISDLPTAQKCALLCAKKCREEILESDDSGKWYWDEIVKHIEAL